MNLREGEVNGFDIGTCRGMRQVMDMSNASILKQLRLDESEYSDMLAEQREMITKLRDDWTITKKFLVFYYVKILILKIIWKNII